MRRSRCINSRFLRGDRRREKGGGNGVLLLSATQIDSTVERLAAAMANASIL